MSRRFIDSDDMDVINNDNDDNDNDDDEVIRIKTSARTTAATTIAEERVPLVARTRNGNGNALALRDDLDEIDFEKSYWLMKEREWERLQRGTYWTPGGFSIGWFSGFVFVFVVYLVMQLAYFRRVDNELEFILMGLLSCVYGYFITRFQWLWRLVALELYSFALFFFLLGLYHQPNKYLPLLTGVLGSVTLTMFVFFIYPYVFRCFLGGTGAIVTRLLDTDRETQAPRYEIEVRNWFASQSGEVIAICFYFFQLMRGRKKKKKRKKNPKKQLN